MVKRRKKTAASEELFLFAPSSFEGAEGHSAETTAQQGEPTAAASEAEEAIVSATEGHAPLVVNRQVLKAKMTDCMAFLDSLSDYTVRLIAMESAAIYQSGMNRGNIYHLQSLPKRDMDWYEFVAMFYCAFGHAFPSMLDKIDPTYIDCYREVSEA